MHRSTTGFPSIYRSSITLEPKLLFSVTHEDAHWNASHWLRETAIANLGGASIIGPIRRPLLLELSKGLHFAQYCSLAHMFYAAQVTLNALCCLPFVRSKGADCLCTCLLCQIGL